LNFGEQLRIDGLCREKSDYFFDQLFPPSNDMLVIHGTNFGFFKSKFHLFSSNKHLLAQRFQKVLSFCSVAVSHAPTHPTNNQLTGGAGGLNYAHVLNG
jgi:hypothetical protein